MVNTTSVSREDLERTLATLGSDERQLAQRLLVQIAGAGQRTYRLNTLLSILMRMDTRPAYWNVLNQPDGKQMLVANFVNGQVSTLEIKGHV